MIILVVIAAIAVATLVWGVAATVVMFNPRQLRKSRRLQDELGKDLPR